MAELAASKKYFNLENVRLAYRAKDDTFHLTAQDEDFPEGFHMTLSRNSNLELRVRELFEDSGVGPAPVLPKPLSTEAPNAIVVGSVGVEAALIGLCRDWNFLPSVNSIPALWSGLKDSSIDNDVQYMFIMDTLFDQAGLDKSFEELAATMAPHCFFAILNYRPELQGVMRERIEEEMRRQGVPDITNYFFIDPQRPRASLRISLDLYELRDQEAALPNS